MYVLTYLLQVNTEIFKPTALKGGEITQSFWDNAPPNLLLSPLSLRPYSGTLLK